VFIVPGCWGAKEKQSSKNVGQTCEEQKQDCLMSLSTGLSLGLLSRYRYLYKIYCQIDDRSGMDTRKQRHISAGSVWTAGDPMEKKENPNELPSLWSLR